MTDKNMNAEEIRDLIDGQGSIDDLSPEEIVAIVEQAMYEDKVNAMTATAALDKVTSVPEFTPARARSGFGFGGSAELKRMCNRVILFFLCLTVIAVGGIFVADKVAAGTPYAITAGDNTLCYVSNKAAADKVISKLVESYTADGASVKAVDSGDIKAEMVKDEQIPDNGIKGVKEAMASVDEAVKSDDDLNITVAGSRTDVEKFTPEPTYQKDDDLFAGEEVIVEEGKDGNKKVTKMITTVNGKVDTTDVVKEEIVNKGKSAVIAKGTLGLPDGENWKTYEGDPVFNDADDLIATCKKYIGAPYKYGGHSLVHGIDCVQYVRQMFAKYGISIPNKHKDIQKVGKGVSLSQAQPGDIVCWTGHVGIYIGNGKVINATRKKGVTISSVHMKKKLVTIRRVPRN